MGGSTSLFRFIKIASVESNVVALQELLYLGLMTANDTQQYSLTEDGIQLLSWVTEVEIYE